MPLPSSPAPSAPPPAPARLGAHVLCDQFGAEHPCAAVLGRWSVLVLADRRGVDALRAWTQALRVALASRTDAGAPEREALPVRAVLAIPGVPRPLRGAVARLLPREREATVLLDWEDALRALHAPGAACSVALVDPAGDVVRCVEVTAAVDDATLHLLLDLPAPLS